MNGKTLYEETPYLRMFPDPNTVFANRVEEHADLLLPVATISLKHTWPKWPGHIHIIMPVEPVGGYGYPGDGTAKYHNYLCRPNWVAYRMIDDKCELACDFRFFHKAYYEENPPKTETQKSEAKELSSHYSHIRAEFLQHAEFFSKLGWLCQTPEEWSGRKKDKADFKVCLIRDLGGTSFEGNWSNGNDFPMSKYPDQFEDRGEIIEMDRVLPQTEDGRDFHYICEVEMWNYIGDTNGVLVVFYDPEKRDVLTTIDWT